MEKLRRKRVNDSLSQLRTLLPRSAFMKKDMASILEQTVEYINIMHNILNEEEPACLSKIFEVYRCKTEEIVHLRKNMKKMKKRKSEPECLWDRAEHSYGPGPPNMTMGPTVQDFHSSANMYEPPAYHSSWPRQSSSSLFLHPQQHCANAPNLEMPCYHQFGLQANYPDGINSKHYHVDSHFQRDTFEYHEPSQNDDCVASNFESASSSQVSTDEVSHSSQSSGHDIEAAAIATGILNVGNSKMEMQTSAPASYFNQMNQNRYVNPFSLNEPWLHSGSLPPISLGQPCYTTSDTRQEVDCAAANLEGNVSHPCFTATE